MRRMIEFAKFPQKRDLKITGVLELYPGYQQKPLVMDLKRRSTRIHDCFPIGARDIHAYFFQLENKKGRK
jgi:hypothetical protein